MRASAMRRITTLVAAALLSACFQPIVLQGHVRLFGKYDAPPAPAASLTPEDVEVFVGTAPPGFALDGDKMSITPGYDHQVIGLLEVNRLDGDCEIEPDRDVYDATIAAMKRAAAEAGATAVVFAQTLLRKGSTSIDVTGTLA